MKDYDYHRPAEKVLLDSYRKQNRNKNRLLFLAVALTVGVIFCMISFAYGKIQVDIQKHWRMLANGLHDRNADRDIRHKNAVHHVYMDVVCAAGSDLCNVIAERAKVCRENGWCKFGHGCHSDLKGSGRAGCSATRYN